MDWQQYELEREQRLATARDHSASIPLEDVDAILRPLVMGHVPDFDGVEAKVIATF